MMLGTQGGKQLLGIILHCSQKTNSRISSLGSRVYHSFKTYKITIAFIALTETLIPVGVRVGVSDGVWVGKFDGVCEGETEIIMDYNR